MDDTSRRVGTIRLVEASVIEFPVNYHNNSYKIGHPWKESERYPYRFPFINNSWEWYEIADTATEWERQEIQLFRLIGAAEWERLYAEEMFKETVAIAG